MSVLDRTKQPRQFDTVTLFAIACLATAGFGVAWELATMMRIRGSLSTGGPVNHVSTIVANGYSYWSVTNGHNYWFVVQTGALLVAGIGLLRRTRWGWWLALGVCALSFGEPIADLGTRLGSGVSVDFQGIVFAILGLSSKPFTLALLIFLFVAPSMRAILCPTDEPADGSATESPSHHSARDSQALGWVLLGFTITTIVYMCISLPDLWSTNAYVARNMPGAADFLALQRSNLLFTCIVSIPLMLGEVLLALAAGFGTLRNRPWATRVTFWFAALWIASVTLNLVWGWFTVWAFPVKQLSGSFPSNPVVHGAYIIAAAIHSFSYVVLPVLLLFLLRLPQFRVHTDTPVPA